MWPKRRSTWGRRVPGREADAADEFIFTTLHGDATLMGLVTDVYNSEGTQGVAIFPAVIFQFMSAVDYAAVGAARIWADMIYLVKVVGETADYAVLGPAVARIDTLLHRASGTVTDGTVWSCTREQPFRMVDNVASKQYRHAGATYRILAI